MICRSAGGMTATSRAPRRPRVRAPARASPPTPIRTARGARSAAADELVLAEFLEASLRVPDLALPPKMSSRRSFRYPAPPPTPDVLAGALLSGPDPDAARTAVGAAAESGAFRVGGAVDAGEVRAAVEAAEAVFRAPEEVKRELGRWFRRRDRVAGEEFYWFRPATASSDDDRVLDAALPGSTYQVLRYTRTPHSACAFYAAICSKFCPFLASSTSNVGAYLKRVSEFERF